MYEKFKVFREEDVTNQTLLSGEKGLESRGNACVTYREMLQLLKTYNIPFPLKEEFRCETQGIEKQ